MTIKNLTPEARKYAKLYLESLGREEVTQMLEDICIACYDDESFEDDLVPSAVDSVEAGDIEIPWGIYEAKAAGHQVYMAWLDIDERWE